MFPLYYRVKSLNVGEHYIRGVIYCTVSRLLLRNQPDRVIKTLFRNTHVHVLRRLSSRPPLVCNRLFGITAKYLPFSKKKIKIKRYVIFYCDLEAVIQRFQLEPDKVLGVLAVCFHANGVLGD